MVEFGNLGSLIRSAGCAVSLDPTSYLLQDEKAPSPVILSVWHTGLMLSPWHPCTILFPKYNINEPPLMQRYEFIIAFIGQDLGRRSELQRSSVTLAAKAENGG